MNVQTLPSSQIIGILSPIFSVCKYFGFVPFEIKHGQLYSLKNKFSFWYWYPCFIWAIATIYMVFHISSLINCAIKGHDIFSLVSQSLWLGATIVSYTVLLSSIWKGDQLRNLLDQWMSIERDMNSMFCPIKTKAKMCHLRLAYLTLTMFSATLCCYYAITQPYHPEFPAYYIWDDENEMNRVAGSKIFVYGSAIFQTVAIFWKWAGYGMLEISTCVMAFIFIQCLEAIIEKLKMECVEKWKDRRSGHNRNSVENISCQVRIVLITKIPKTKGFKSQCRLFIVHKGRLDDSEKCGKQGIFPKNHKPNKKR